MDIAFQVHGDGPRDLLVVPGLVSHVEFLQQHQSFRRFLERMSSFARVIVFDKRGNGLSDRVTGAPTLEERADDARAVLDAVESDTAALLGASEGGPMSILFAATYPTRCSALILWGTFARFMQAHRTTHSGRRRRCSSTCAAPHSSNGGRESAWPGSVRR